MLPSLTITCNKIVSTSWIARCIKWSWPINRLSHTSRVLQTSETRVTWSIMLATRILDIPTLCSQLTTNWTTSLTKIRPAPLMSRAKQIVEGIRLRLVIRWPEVKGCSSVELTLRIIPICRRLILPKRLDQITIVFFYHMLPEPQAFPSQIMLETIRQMLNRPGTPKHWVIPKRTKIGTWCSNKVELIQALTIMALLMDRPSNNFTSEPATYKITAPCQQM